MLRAHADHREADAITLTGLFRRWWARLARATPSHSRQARAFQGGPQGTKSLKAVGRAGPRATSRVTKSWREKLGATGAPQARVAGCVPRGHMERAVIRGHAAEVISKRQRQQACPGG